MSAPRNRAMARAMQRAVASDDPGARDLAYTMAEAQRDGRSVRPRPAARTSVGYPGRKARRR